MLQEQLWGGVLGVVVPPIIEREPHPLCLNWTATTV